MFGLSLPSDRIFFKILIINLLSTNNKMPFPFLNENISVKYNYTHYYKQNKSYLSITSMKLTHQQVQNKQNCLPIKNESNLNVKQLDDKQMDDKFLGNKTSSPQNTHIPLQRISDNQIDRDRMFRKKQWTERQDRLLVKAISLYGPKRWASIAEYIPNRIGKQCRERWHNHLNPKINKNQWTQFEEWMLFLMHTLYKGKWAKMTKVLSQRTDNSIKNHWNSIMKKKIIQFQNKLQELLSKGEDNILLGKQKHFIDKIRSKRQRISHNAFQPNSDNPYSQQLSSFNQEESAFNRFDQNKYLCELMKQSSSQFQVNIEGVLPETSENLPLKQKKHSLPSKDKKQNSQIVDFMLQQMDQLDQAIPEFPKSQSTRQVFPNLLFQKRQSSDFQIYGSSLRRQQKSSFNENNDFCSSPRMRVRYSQILASQSEEGSKQDLFVKDLHPRSEQQQLGSLLGQFPQQQTYNLKKRLSRNISIVSPTKFIQKSSPKK